MVQGVPAIVSNMLALWQRHEVIANNLANASTPGFKRDDLLPVPPPAQPTAAGGGTVPDSVPAALQWTDFSQGLIHHTGRDLDVALNGPGFLVVDTPGGLRYTRNGTLSLGPDGFLVTASGAKVLGQRGPIRVPPGRVTITPPGEVRVAGQTVDTLRVVEFPAPQRLLKEGNGLFVPADPAAEPRPATGSQVVGESLEGSNVSPVEAMVSMIEILRTYEAAQRAIQAADEVNRQAVNEVGRVA